VKKQINKRFLSLAVCLAIISLSAFAVFANGMQQGDLGRDIIREGESVLPDTDNGNVGDGLLPAPDTDNGDVGEGLVPAPDTKPEAPESDKGTMDKEDAKPDDGHDVKKDDEGEKRFNYTGLIVALIIAVAAVILIIIMIPSSKRNGNTSSGERKK